MEKKVTVDISLATILRIIAIFIGLFLVFFLREIFILILLAFILQAGFSGFVESFEKRGWHRIWGILLIYFGLFLVLAAVIGLIVPPVSAQIQNLISQFPDYFQKVLSYFVSSGYAEKISQNIKEIINISQITRFGSGFLSAALGVFGGIFGVIMVLILTFYFLVEKNAFNQALLNILPSNVEPKVTAFLSKFNHKMSFWLKGQAILSGSIGFVSFIGLSLLGVPYALTLAIFAGFAELIPIIGPILSASVAIIVALATKNLMLAVWVGLLFFAIQQLENYVLAPLVMKKAVGLSPLIIIISILIGAKILGILGMVIAIPVTTGIMIAAKEWGKK